MVLKLPKTEKNLSWLATLFSSRKKQSVSLTTNRATILPILLLVFNFFLCFSSHLKACDITLPINAKCKSNDLFCDYPLFGLKTIVIDAGHGGHDPGCIGGHVHEKKITLAIAKKLGETIKAVYPHINVIQTRTDDTFVPLHERAAIANRNKADLFISIHCNYMPGSGATHGSETYVMGLHKAEHNLNVAKRENASILLEANYEQHYDYDPNSPEGHILLSMVQNVYLEQSILFAQAVEDEFHADKRKSRGVKQAGFVVLKETTMPSVLIEVGFLSNKTEEKFLMGQEGQSQVATSIVSALTTYKQKIEGDDVVVASPAGFKWNEPSTRDLQPKGVSKKVVQKKAVVYASTPKNTNHTPIVMHPSALSKEVKEDPLSVTDPRVLENTLQQAAQRQPVREVAPPPAKEKNSYSSATPLRYPGSDNVDESTWIAPAEVASPSPATKFRAKGGNSIQSNDVVKGVMFKVQLMASPTPVNTTTALWQRIDYGVEVVQEQGYFKYMIHNLNSIEEAQRAQSAVRQRGFSDAFLVAYKNGKRISLDEARGF